MPALITWWTQDASELAPHASPQTVTDEGVRLLQRWTTPGRSYHSTQHLVEVSWALEDLEEAGELTPDEARIARVAAWFHDAHHDARAEHGSNEHRSASLARDHLHALGAEDDVVDEVERLVLLTIDHRPGADDRPGRAFCDADLWILSADPARYAEYTAQVREEYRHVPEALFREGRRAVLTHLGEGDLYGTSFARQHWTEQARANLTQELATLT